MRDCAGHTFPCMKVSLGFERAIFTLRDHFSGTDLAVVDTSQSEDWSECLSHTVSEAPGICVSQILHPQTCQPVVTASETVGTHLYVSVCCSLHSTCLVCVCSKHTVTFVQSEPPQAFAETRSGVISVWPSALHPRPDIHNAGCPVWKLISCLFMPFAFRLPALL